MNRFECLVLVIFYGHHFVIVYISVERGDIFHHFIVLVVHGNYIAMMAFLHIRFLANLTYQKWLVE